MDFFIAATSQIIEEPTTSSLPPTSTVPPMSPSSTNLPNQSLLGFIQNVSPTKVSRKGSEYFSFQLQQRNAVIKAISFSPRKHKAIVERKAESGTPCKISKFSIHASEANVIWVNPNTQINDALETAVDFSKETMTAEQASLCTTRDVEELQIYQSISIKGFVLFGDRQPEKIPTKKDLTKREGCLVDEAGSVLITLWNEQIELIAEGFYEVQNIRLRQYFGEKYLSASTDTIFNKIADNPPKTIPQQHIREALDKLRLDEISCLDINSADIQIFYTCVNCAKKVLFHQESMLRCANCQSRFLISKSKKTTAVRVSLKDHEDGLTWYTLFTPMLEDIIHHYNEKHEKQEALDQIDDDKLCNIVLELQGLKLKLNSTRNVIGVDFDIEN